MCKVGVVAATCVLIRWASFLVSQPAWVSAIGAGEYQARTPCCPGANHPGKGRKTQRSLKKNNERFLDGKTTISENKTTSVFLDGKTTTSENKTTSVFSEIVPPTVHPLICYVCLLGCYACVEETASQRTPDPAYLYSSDGHHSPAHGWSTRFFFFCSRGFAITRDHSK